MQFLIRILKQPCGYIRRVTSVLSTGRTFDRLAIKGCRKVIPKCTLSVKAIIGGGADPMPFLDSDGNHVPYAQVGENADYDVDIQQASLENLKHHKSDLRNDNVRYHLTGAVIPHLSDLGLCRP